MQGRELFVPGQFVTPGLRSSDEKFYRIDRKHSFLEIMKGGKWGFQFAGEGEVTEQWLGLLSVVVEEEGLPLTPVCYKKREDGRNDWSLSGGAHIMARFKQDYDWWCVQPGVDVVVLKQSFIKPDTDDL